MGQCTYEMVEAAGVEPASTISLNSSHSQVWLIYYHKLTKIVGCQPTLTHLLRSTYRVFASQGHHCDFFIFAGIDLLAQIG